MEAKQVRHPDDDRHAQLRAELEQLKEKAVQIVHARNLRRAALGQQLAHAADLRARAEAARKNGAEELVLLVERDACERYVELLRDELRQVEQDADAVKIECRAQEARVRQSAEARLERRRRELEALHERAWQEFERHLETPSGDEAL